MGRAGRAAPTRRGRRARRDGRRVRGVTRRGRIYDFALTLVNDSEFCGGCFSADGETFFLNQQGGRLSAGQDPAAQPASDAGLTYAIWGPFDEGRKNDRDLLD